MTDGIVFLGFIGLQCCFFASEHFANNCTIAWLRKRHYLVWLIHPVVLHSIKDYAIHIVIYSGKIIAAH